MPKMQFDTILAHIRRCAFKKEARASSDRQLLESFVARREEGAFALLVERHGPLVLGVCRRILQNEHDAEDAFQATFMVLARRAASVQWRDSVAGWLYETAARVAAKARAQNYRAMHEKLLDVANGDDPLAGLAQREQQCLIEEEIRRLPDKYRLPLLLCALAGLSRADAAKQLGWPEGTVAGRLARARDILEKRLRRRGVAIPAAVGAIVATHGLASAAVSASLAKATLQAALAWTGPAAATAAVSAKAALLAKGTLHSMLLTKLKLGLAVVLTLGLTAGGVGVAVFSQASRDNQPPKPAGPAIPEKAEPPMPKAAETDPPTPKPRQSEPRPGANPPKPLDIVPLPFEQPPSGEKIYEQLLKSTAWVVVESEKGSWSGSGTLVDKANRLVLTSYGIAGDGDGRTVVFFPQYFKGKLLSVKSHYRKQLQNGEGRSVGWVVAKAPKKNLAVIKLANLPDMVSELPISESSAKPGQRIHSIGNPEASDALWVFGTGRVHQVGREQFATKLRGGPHEIDATVVQTQAPSNLGDSGGPIVNDRGELVAVTGAGMGLDGVLAHFIDVSEVRDVLNRYYRSTGLKKNSSGEIRGGGFKGEQVIGLLSILREEKDARRRATAAVRLGELGPDAKTAARSLASCLKENDEDLRRSAAVALNNIGSVPSDLVSALSDALKDPNPDVRCAIASVLMKTGPAAKDAAPALIAALNDPDAKVRALSTTALGSIRPAGKAVVPALTEVLEDSEVDVRVAAAGALAKFGREAKSAVPALTTALKTEDRLLRLQILSALASIGPESKQALPGLKQLLKDSNWETRRAAMSTLGAIGPAAKDAFKDLISRCEDRDSAEAVAKTMEKIGKAIVPDLINVLGHANEWVRCGAADSLGRIGPDAKESLPALKATAEKDPSVEVRGAASKAIRKIKAG